MVVMVVNVVVDVTVNVVVVLVVVVAMVVAVVVVVVVSAARQTTGGCGSCGGDERGVANHQKDQARPSRRSFGWNKPTEASNRAAPP